MIVIESWANVYRHPCFPDRVTVGIFYSSRHDAADAAAAVAGFYSQNVPECVRPLYRVHVVPKKTPDAIVVPSMSDERIVDPWRRGNPFPAS